MKKHTRKHNGKNIFPQSRYTNIIEADKNVAMDQVMEILAALDTNPNSKEEYTLDLSCFPAEERQEFEVKVIQILALRSRMKGHTYELAVTPLPPKAA